MTALVLLYRDETGCATAFDKYFANTMSRRFGRNHRHVNGIRWLDLTEADIEAVREHERVARIQVRLNFVLVDVGLLGVRDQDHDHVSDLRRICYRRDDQ